MKNRPRYRFSLTVILAVLGIFLLGYLRPEPISSVIQKERFWATKVHSKKKYDVIVAGDSRVYRGVDPISVSKQLDGLKVLNFGFSSGGHNPFIFKEIEQRLYEKAEHKIIVLALTPYSLTKKAQDNAHFRQEKDRDEKDVFLRRYVNPALSFFDPIKPTDLLHMNDTTQGYYEKFRSDGWVESKKIPYNNRAALKRYVKDFKDNRVDLDVFQEVLSNVKQWKSKGILVFVLRMPTTKAMEELENELSGYDENWIKIELEKAGGVWIPFDNRFEYVSYDGSHLDGESAKRFSMHLGGQIQQFLKPHGL